MDYIKGNFRKKIFKSEQGYTIGLFKVREVSSDNLNEYINKTVTFTGYFPELNENDYYLFHGEFKNHDRYGLQFTVASYEVMTPEGKDAVIMFLSSDLFKGIGEKKAEKIVEVLGDGCLDVIINNPNSLMLVPGVTEKQKDTIYEALVKYQASYKIIVYLTELGFNTKDALTIFYNYYNDTKKVIEDNIYTLIDDIHGLSFRKIDNLKSNLNITNNDERRIKAGIKYALNEAANTLGDTYLYKDELINYTMRAIDIRDYDKIDECISDLIVKMELINEQERYYLKDYYLREKYIAKRLNNLANLDGKKVNEKYLNQLENTFDITFNNDQKKAITSSLEESFLIITGGPGTGKTTIIKAICELYSSVYKLTYEELVKELALLAPTGRASKRMSESTGLGASTIHRFLKWDKETNLFGINEDNKSDVKLIIVDESSMIDVNLFYSLLVGITDKCKIILVGDYDQLPSVGAGQVLKDLIESDMFNVIKLKELYRQAKDSNIIKFAYDINNQQLDMSIFNKSDDLFFIPCTSIELKDKLFPIIKDYQKEDYNKFQILAPIYAYENGIDDLNKFAQKILNPSNNEIFVGESNFRENDKILQLVNMPDENIYNGDLGILDRINTKPKEIYVNFDSNVVKFTPSIFNNITHGYCISIHKSQGSEFDTVIIPVLNKYSRMLYKKLLYTASTRAKKKLYILGEVNALNQAIMNDSSKVRKTTLKDFIIESIISKK